MWESGKRKGSDDDGRKELKLCCFTATNRKTEICFSSSLCLKGGGRNDGAVGRAQTGADLSLYQLG